MSMKENEQKISDLKSSLSRLKDDMAQVRSELANFKRAVAADMTRLVNLQKQQK